METRSTKYIRSVSVLVGVPWVLRTRTRLSGFGSDPMQNTTGYSNNHDCMKKYGFWPPTNW